MEFHHKQLFRNQSDEVKVAYSQSLEKLRDIQEGIIFAADRAREEGKEAGYAKHS